MKKFVSVFLALSLFLAPAVHAFEVDCLVDTESNFVQDHKDFSKGEKQSETEKSTHHCCAHNVLDRTAVKADTVMITAVKMVIVFQDDSLSSLAFEPLLEPPSHA